MATTRSIGTIALGVATVVCAGAALYWWLGVDRTEVYTDGGLVAAPADAASPRDVLWRPPEGLGTLNGAMGEGTPRVAPGGDEIWFSRTAGDTGSDLYVARRDGESWGEPAPVGALNTVDHELGAVVSAEGAWVYFASDRPGGMGGTDIWRAPREGDAWGEPEALGASVNSAADELDPALFVDADGAPGLMFASDRGGDGEVGEAFGFDLYRAALGAEDGGDPELLSALSSAADDVGIAASPGGDFVYFSSNRDGGAGGFDLYRARLTADGFGRIENLGYPINTAANELEPGLAMGGFALLYASDGEGTRGGTDLYRSVSREVYLASGTRFAGLWGDLLALLPWILALLALVLLLAMLRRVHAGGAWEGRLSTLGLMARCVLLSLVLHAALMALLALWQVQLAPGSLDGTDEGTRVALSSGSGAEALGAQVRGGFTEAEVSRAEAESASRPEVAVEAARAPGSSELAAERSAESGAEAMRVTVAPSELVADERAGMDWAEEVAEVAPERSAAALGVPEAGRRGMRAEAERSTARGTTAAAGAAGPSAEVVAAGSAPTRAVDPAPVGGGRDGADRAMAVEVARGEADGLDGAIGVPSADLTLDAGAPAASVAAPAAGGRVASAAREATGGVERASAGTGSAPVVGDAALAAGRARTAEIAVTATPAAGDEAMGVNAPIAAATPGEPARAALGDEPPDLGGLGEGLALGEIGVPDGAEDQRGAVAADGDIGVARVGTVRSAMADVTVGARGADSRRDVVPEFERAGDGAGVLGFDAGTQDASPTAEDDGLGAAGTPELALDPPDDGLGGIGVPDAGHVSADARRAAGAEADARQARAPVLGSGGAPVVEGAAGSAAAEIAADVAHAVDDSLAVPVGEAAGESPDPRADEDSALAGMPDAPDLAPMEAAAFAIPTPTLDTRLQLTGRVLDSETGEPIAGALVRVDLLDSAAAEVATDSEGAFELGFEDVPDHIALAASAEGYVPGALNIAEDDLEDGAYAVIRLDRFNPFEIAMEDEPRVHHLGNDEYTGRINSQFQRESEGREVRFEFDLGPEQLPPNVAEAEVVLLAKGVQLSNPVGVNGRKLQGTLRESPSDGSFGEQRIWVPLELLQEGENWVAIRSVREPGTDIDDFELVNVRLVLRPASGDAAQ